ncbi:hypothetical protein MHBO_002963 [Bonamia ostreae]|uniref:Uncharacterized protein n=1 Tax=Bonamia ostreae TaxID=126728 RepID=A0ABV2AP28_9EUKA
MEDKIHFEISTQERLLNQQKLKEINLENKKNLLETEKRELERLETYYESKNVTETNLKKELESIKEKRANISLTNKKINQKSIKVNKNMNDIENFLNSQKCLNLDNGKFKIELEEKVNLNRLKETKIGSLKVKIGILNDENIEASKELQNLMIEYKSICNFLKLVKI